MNGRALKVASILSYLVSVIALLSIAFVTFVLLWPFEPVRYTRVDLLTPVVRAGDRLSYTVHFIKSVDKVGTMSRYLTCKDNRASITLGPSGLADALPTDIMKKVSVEIPSSSDPGICKVRWTVGYDYFGIRTVIVRAETPWFHIID
jgi:hypothetical protein